MVIILNEKRTLNQNEKQFFLDLKPDDITKTLLIELFANRYDAENQSFIKSKYNTYDEFTLNKGDYPTITESIKTNCGLFIVNKFLFEEDWIEHIGYLNKPIDDKQKKALNNMLVELVLQDATDDTRQKYVNYINKQIWLELTFHTEICASLSIKSSKPIKKVQDRKKELLKKHKDEIANGDVVVATDIQTELINLAKNEMKDDPAIELYESGARGSFDNAYRQEHLIKGPIYNAANNKFEIMTNSLYEGAEKDNLPSFANAVVDGLYPKSVGTQVSGYDAKKITAILQSEVLDEKGSDCGSKFPLDISLTESNVSTYMYHYIYDNGKYVCLDKTNKNKYVGKTVKMRLPSTCRGQLVCNCCAGERYYMLGIKNIGLTGNRAANSLLNGKMKMSHDTTVRTHKLNLDDLVIPFNE